MITANKLVQLTKEQYCIQILSNIFFEIANYRKYHFSRKIFFNIYTKDFALLGIELVNFGIETELTN